MPANRKPPSLAPAPPSGFRYPETLDDIALQPAERGLLLGKTGTGKTSLLDALIRYDHATYPNQDIIVFDTKPCYKGERELTGMSTTGRWGRYRRWDDNKGVLLRDSVVISPDLGTAASCIDQAFAQKYNLIVAQITKHDDIPWLAQVMRHAYENKRKNRGLRFYVDELNHWMRRHKLQADTVIEFLTSGRENNVGMLLGAQRPRNIGIESIESATALYWFWTPWEEDIKMLRGMGISGRAHPGAKGSYIFYVYNEDTKVAGQARLPKPDRKSPASP